MIGCSAVAGAYRAEGPVLWNTSQRVFEVDFRLIQWRLKQVIRSHLYARAGGRTDRQPIQPQRVATNNPVLRRQR